jgi:hypothetical protein
MQIVPYAPHHLHTLALQPHQQHLGVALRAHGWAEQVTEAGPCWTALAGGEPIACAGFDLTNSVLTGQATRAPEQFLRWVRDGKWQNADKAKGCRTIKDSGCAYRSGHKWIFCLRAA